MQLIIIVILGAFFGFLYGMDSNGFIFSSKICLFAGITLIMPSLFNFELTHVKLVWEHKRVILKGLLINYMVLPVIALAIGFTTGDFGITAGLFLLAVLSGGGMVMFWIKKSRGDTSLGFLLLFINLLLITLSLQMLHIFATYSADYFDASYTANISVSRFSGAVLMLLIIIPFIVSRIIRYIKPLMKLIQDNQKYISNVSIFIILFYLFGLQNTQLLVDVYDFEPELFPIAFAAVVVFYLLTIVVSKWIYDLDSPQEKAAFWHSVTRYLTLALVIASFSAYTFGVSMLLPIMFAYVVQIPLAVYISKKFNVA